MFSEGSGAAAGVAWRRHVLRELRGRRSEYSLPGAAGACGRAQWPVGKESLGGDKSKGWTWLTMRKRSVFFLVILLILYYMFPWFHSRRRDKNFEWDAALTFTCVHLHPFVDRESVSFLSSQDWPKTQAYSGWGWIKFELFGSFKTFQDAGRKDSDLQPGHWTWNSFSRCLRSLSQTAKEQIVSGVILSQSTASVKSSN